MSSPLWNGERGRTMTADAPSPMLAAALSYAEKFGWKIFPARMEDGKKWSFLSAEFAPGGENWGMTNDPQQLAVNFNNRRWLHKCGVGIPTGAVNRIFIVEADTKKGHDVDGIESLRNLEARHTPFPETLMAESPSGSQHHYFNNPKNVTIKNSTSEIAPGVDVRGEGGMVVAPPSVRGDGAYRWLNEGTPIADAPKWLIELVRRDDAEAPRTVVNCGPVPAHLLGIGGVGKSTNPRDGYSREAEAARIAAAMEVIPNPDLGWEEWNKRGMAVFSASAGSEAGFKAFDEFSKKSKKYNAATTYQKWSDYFRYPPISIGAGSIFHWADELDPNWRTSIPDELTDDPGRPNTEQKTETIEAKPAAAVDTSKRKRVTNPVDLWAKFDPPPLPNGLLPKVIEDFAFEQSELIGADPSGLAMAALAACAAAIPDYVKLRPKKYDTWSEAARIWVAPDRSAEHKEKSDDLSGSETNSSHRCTNVA